MKSPENWWTFEGLWSAVPPPPMLGAAKIFCLGTIEINTTRANSNKVIALSLTFGKMSTIGQGEPKNWFDLLAFN